MRSSRAYSPVDISSDAFWRRSVDERHEAFAELRDTEPVSWHEPPETQMMPGADDPGFWALTRHADIKAVSRDPRVFSSSAVEFGGVMFEDMPPDILEATSSILVMDDPEHAHVRKIISSVFTPKRVARLGEAINGQARRIVDDVAPRGEAEFVSEIASRLPMWTVSEMVGIPERFRPQVERAAHQMFAWNDDDAVAAEGDAVGVMLSGMGVLHTTAFELCEEKRANPGDDVLSALVHAEVDGRRLTDEEVAAFFVLLCSAGNDTTRQTTSLGMHALCRFPDERRRLVMSYDELIPTAVEELVRWVSPVMTFRRTAREDVQVGDRMVAAGEKVVMIYPSGNRDESVFDKPFELDLSRRPNDHVGFGGGGPHFCLGNHVARLQLTAIFRELLHRLPDLEVGEPEYLGSNFVNGVKRMPCTFTPA